MTRAEIRIAAAMKRLHAAEDAFRRAAEAKRKAEAALASRTQPKIWAARRAVREARAAVTIAQLAARGITPMQTIVEWKGKRYAVRVSLEGWHRLVPVTKRGWMRDDMNQVSAPYEWRGVTITGDVVQVRP